MGACDEVAVYDIALRRRFRRIDRRSGVLIRGEAGWGEISPFWDYGPAESARWFAAGLEAATVPFPPVARDRVPVNATVPVCDPAAAVGIVAAHPGVRAVKVKVADPGVELREDCARVAAVAEALAAGGGGVVRVDANGAWEVDEAARAIRELDAAAGGLEYVEQPCAEVEEMARVRRAVNVAVAADESVRRAGDPLAVVRAGACDLIVTKVQPLGGVRAALAVAEEAGVPVVVSSAVDSSVGLAMGAHLAAVLPELPHPCGLGTLSLLTGDVSSTPLTVREGAIDVRRVAPDVADAAPVTPELVSRWLRRLDEVAAWMESAR
nr:o-succinylbenzoate synthase [Nanchangia anserum]